MLNVPRFLPFLRDFFTSPDVPARSKIISVLLVLGYFLFPFDVVPDFLVLLGFVDDLAVLAFVLQRIVKLAPPHIKQKHGVLE